LSYLVDSTLHNVFYLSFSRVFSSICVIKAINAATHAQSVDIVIPGLKSSTVLENLSIPVGNPSLAPIRMLILSPLPIASSIMLETLPITCPLVDVEIKY